MNVVMGIAMLLTMLFCVGPLEAALEVGAPYLVMFKNTGSDGLTTFLLVVLLVLVFSGHHSVSNNFSRVMGLQQRQGLPILKLDFQGKSAFFPQLWVWLS